METDAEKLELRQRLRAMLASLPDSQRRAKSAGIWERLALLPELAVADWLLVYVSKPHEVDTHGLIQQLLAMGRHVCVPAFEPAAQQYIASELRDFASELSEGKFGILEPKPAAVRPVPVETLQALLLPGLGFDARGNRLGRGLGYFDRLLRQARGAKIGLAFDFQLLERVPADAHDVRMDVVVTETKTLRCRENP